MRITRSTRVLLLGTLLAGTPALAPAGDELFLPSYQRMGLAPPTAPTAPATSAPVAAPTAAPAPVPVAPVGRAAVPAGRPRANWNQATHWRRTPVAPVAPTAAPNPVAPAPAMTVAAALSVPAEPPAYQPSSRGLIARFRKDEPPVPPGLPRNAGPLVMVPPEPLGADPALAAAGLPAPRGGVDSPMAPARPSLAARPIAREPSAFAPVRASESFPDDPRVPAPAEPIPPLIARPDGPDLDSPLRRAGAGGPELDDRVTPSGGTRHP